MSYHAAMDGLQAHRDKQISSMLGESMVSWFTDEYDSVKDMLDALSSDGENAAIASKYTTAAASERAADNLRLDYVCALRREVRKQYVSGDGDVCTDVTPFRHGIISAHGSKIFDQLLSVVVTQHSVDIQATGGSGGEQWTA